MKVQVYLNEGRDNFFGFHNEFANAPALRLALVFTTPDNALRLNKFGAPGELLEWVFEQLNVGGDLVEATDWTTVYRRHGNRSLSVGDVVVVGETAYACEGVGWVRITTDDLLEAISRYKQAHRTAV